MDWASSEGSQAHPRQWSIRGRLMGQFALILLLLVATGLSSTAQEPISMQAAPPPGAGKPDQQANASSAGKDTSATTGDQVTKPAGARSSTLIGCLSRPDTNDRFLLTSMQHRTGVELLGPDDLKNAIGDKVKLTGTWQPASEQTAEHPAGKSARRFQVTQVEVLSQQCQTPSPTSPSKKR